jgi:hypothetical protein
MDIPLYSIFYYYIKYHHFKVFKPDFRWFKWEKLDNLGFVCKSMFFLGLLIIGFVSNVHESPHDEINGVFILHFVCVFWIKYVLLHILNKMNIISYFDYMNAKNECFYTIKQFPNCAPRCPRGTTTTF